MSNLKGDKVEHTLEKCGRTACPDPHDNCIHSQTGMKYCKRCAMKINHANPEVPNLVVIPIFRQSHGLSLGALSQRIRDLAFGAYGGDFDYKKTFGEQENDMELALMFKYAVAKATGIPIGAMPQLQHLTCDAFAEQVYKLLYEREGTIVPAQRPVSQSV